VSDYFFQSRSSSDQPVFPVFIRRDHIVVRCFNQKMAFSKLPSSDNTESGCKSWVVNLFPDKLKEIHKRFYIFETKFLQIMRTSQCSELKRFLAYLTFIRSKFVGSTCLLVRYQSIIFANSYFIKNKSINSQLHFK
jgi:hypothetical protein